MFWNEPNITNRDDCIYVNWDMYWKSLLSLTIVIVSLQVHLASQAFISPFLVSVFIGIQCRMVTFPGNGLTS